MLFRSVRCCSRTVDGGEAPGGGVAEFVVIHSAEGDDQWNHGRTIHLPVSDKAQGSDAEIAIVYRSQSGHTLAGLCRCRTVSKTHGVGELVQDAGMLLRVVTEGVAERVRVQEQREVRHATDFSKCEEQRFAIGAGRRSGGDQLPQHLERVRSAVGFDEEFQARGIPRRIELSGGKKLYYR